MLVSPFFHMRALSYICFTMLTTLLRYSAFALCFLYCVPFNAQPALEKDLQTRLIMAEDGDTIVLPAGKIALTNTLWLDGKNNITVRGAGQDKTILSFKNQVQGAEGLKITNAHHIVLEQFTLEDSKGDLLKTQNVTGLYCRDVTARWNGKPKKTNGSYALYPVQCTHVVIERCTAIGASDAGIYVGQSDSVWVHHCVAKHNVAGIEIENTTNAWVYENQSFDNTGGLLVFDLPDLPKKRGGNVHVWKNQILRNNYKNFAPKGNIVGKVPPGTGIMVLATDNVHIRDNTIWDNKTISTAIVSYYITETPIKDKGYNPYPSRIAVYNNRYQDDKRMPIFRNKMGVLFWFKFGRRVPHVLWDGIADPQCADKACHICVYDNANGSFANLRADHNFKQISRDVKPHTCTLPETPAPTTSER